MSKDNTIEQNPDTEIKTVETVGEKIEYDMEALRSKAKLLDIDFHPKIGGEKLKAKIDLHLREIEVADIVDETEKGVSSVGPSLTIKEIERAARKPIRVIITDNNPIDVDNPTIVHGVMNEFFKIGPVIIRKDEEQDVPTAIVKALKNKTMVKWVPSVNHITKKPTGNKVAETRKRYNIQIIKE